MSAAAGTTANGVSAYEESGAGGKFRRKPLRKSQATPYDRPPAAIRNTSSGGNGWLSKIIDPASKIIAASAHRLYASVFRKRLLPPPPPPQQQKMPPPPPPPAARQDALEVNRTTDSVPRRDIQFKLGDQSGTNHHSKENVSLDSNGDKQGISELEKIFAQKTFTESEISRLTALLNSQTIEVTAEKASPNTEFKDGILSEFKSSTVPDNGMHSLRYLGASSSHVSRAEVIEEDIATPAELAKAYMGRRPSKVSPSILGSRSQAFRNELPLTYNMVFPSQSPSTRTAIKSLSSVGAPENGYMTPRSRGRSAIYSMARTPYSRLQKSSDIRSVNNYNFQSPQLALEANKLSSSRQTALKRRSNVLDDDIGSAGPIRRIRQKPGFLSSQISNGGNSSLNGPGVPSNYRSKNAGSRTPDANPMSIPSQSSIVAQKILQQLEKLSPPPKEKSSERKSVQLPGKSTFTLTTDTLSGQALRSLEKVDSSKTNESSEENRKVSHSVQRVATNKECTVLNGKNQLEESGPQNPSSVSRTNPESAFNSCEHPLAEKKQAFRISAREDYLEDNNGSSLISLLEDNPQTKSDENGTVPSGYIKFEKEGIVSYSSGSPTMTIQPTATGNVSSSLFGKASADEQTTTTPLFGHGGKAAVKLSPFTFPSSSPTANDSPALQTSALSESRTVNISGLSDTPETKPDDSEGPKGAADMEAKPAAASDGISTTSAMFSSGSVVNNGFSKFSLPVQPTSASSSPQFNGVSPASAATGITSSGVSLFSTSVAPFSASSVFGDSSGKVSQVSANTNVPTSDVFEIAKPVNAVNNITSNPFGGTSSATANGASIFSGFGSVSNAVSSQAKNVTTADESTQQSTLFQFGSSGFSSAPAFSLSGTTKLAPASPITGLPVPALTFGQNSLPSSQEAGSVGSAGGSTNSLFGSNWQSNSSPLFGSTTGFSMVPPSTSQSGSSASLSASIPLSGTPGLFGSSSASTVSTFSFTSAPTSISPSPFSASQPAFGSSNPVFAFGSSASLPNSSINNSQTSMEDTMAEDTVQTSAPSTSMFGQQQSMSNSVFSFGSPSPSVTPPGASIFQFGGQPSPAASLNQTPFQAAGSFDAGGSFSLGTGGADKSGRKIVKVKRGPKRR